MGATRIIESERNRPAGLSNADAAGAPPTAEMEAMREMIRQLVETGMPPSEIADIVFAAIRENRFYILPHPQWKPAIQARMEDILQERPPTFTPAM